MPQTFLIFGNPLLDFDSLPIKLIPQLKAEFPDIKFQEIDPNENLHPKNKHLNIIDTIADIKEPIIIDNIDQIDQIEKNPNLSMHDFDLGFNLKLLKKIGELESIFIIGLPMDYDLNKSFLFVKKIINTNE